VRFSVKVIPRAKANKIVWEGESGKVYLKAPPVEGKANAALIEFLAEHFGVKKRQVRIITGATSRRKIVEIENPATRS